MGNTVPSSNSYWPQMREFLKSQVGMILTLSLIPHYSFPDHEIPIVSSLAHINWAIHSLKTHVRHCLWALAGYQGCVMVILCLSLPSAGRAKYLQGHGLLILIQHLTWCLLTIVFLIAYLFQSKEIVPYNGRKRLSDPV